MRAERLLQLVLLLQNGPRRTGGELAEQLGVSLRTVYRDLDALSVSGVPVYTQPGPSGGVSLLEGWRMAPAPFSEDEITALSASNPSDALGELGLREAHQQGWRKLAALIPEARREAAERARQRLFFDNSPWFRAPEEAPQVSHWRDAVWRDRAVRVGYENRAGVSSTREVEPLGLVCKGGRWYLVGATAEGTRVFRGGRVRSVEVLARRARRPAGFDLGRFWRDWCAAFREERPVFKVRLRLTGQGAERLARDRPERASLGALFSAGGEIELNFEREDIALSQLLPLGGEAEIMAPAGLRARVEGVVAGLAARYLGR